MLHGGEAYAHWPNAMLGGEAYAHWPNAMLLGGEAYAHWPNAMIAASTTTTSSSARRMHGGEACAHWPSSCVGFTPWMGTRSCALSPPRQTANRSHPPQFDHQMSCRRTIRRPWRGHHILMVFYVSHFGQWWLLRIEKREWYGVRYAEPSSLSDQEGFLNAAGSTCIVPPENRMLSICVGFICVLAQDCGPGG